MRKILIYCVVTLLTSYEVTAFAQFDAEKPLTKETVPSSQSVSRPKPFLVSPQEVTFEEDVFFMDYYVEFDETWWMVVYYQDNCVSEDLIITLGSDFNSYLIDKIGE